jgi:hypothetical protein
MAAFVIGGCRFNLGGLHGLAGLLEAVCGLIHRRGCGGAGSGEGLDARCGFGQ